MSPGAIENLLRSAFAPPANRGPEPLALDAFTEHLRPATPAKPPVSEKAPPPAPSKKDAKPPASEEDSTKTDDTAAASTVAANAAAPAPAIQDAEPHDVAEVPIAEVADKGEAETKAKVKPTGKKVPPRALEAAPVEVTQEVGKKDETAAPANSETEATATVAPATDEGAESELLTAKLTQAAPTKKTELPIAVEAVAEATPNAEVAEENTEAVTVDAEGTAPDTASKIDDAAIVTAQKSAAAPKAETKPTASAPRKRASDTEPTVADNTTAAETTPSDNAPAANEVPAEEPTENNVRSPKKNSKASAPPADDRLKADATANEPTETPNSAPTGSEQKPDAAKDYASVTSAVAPDANAAPDRAPAATPPVTPANDSAPLRRASLTLQPPTTERTPGGIRLTEMEQTRFVQRVARAFEAAQQRDGEIRLRLSPPELGSLRLEVKLQGGVMSARIETETEAARTVLLDQLPALRERLQEHNIRVERFDVDLADRRSGGQAQTPDEQGHQPRPEPRRPVLTRTPTLATPNDERPAPRPSGDKGRINVII